MNSLNAGGRQTMRVGRVGAILTTAVSLTFATALLVSAGGCSGSDGSGAGGGSDEGKKLLEQRIKDNQAGKSDVQVPKQK
jgi:hypothetical protein